VLPGDQVFGDPRWRLDVPAQVRAMLAAVGDALGEDIPATVARITRLDITSHLDLGSLSAVRQALSYLRGTEGGRYRVSQQAGDTVYWSHKSRLRSGKAYAKGPHLEYEAKKHPGFYSPEQFALANRLLRLELKLGAQWHRERGPGQPEPGPSDLTPDVLRAQWSEYFSRLVGDGVRVSEVSDVWESVKLSAKTDGQARSAYALWGFIQAHGWQMARETYPRRTWYRLVGILHAAGLSDTDISHGTVTPIRRAPLSMREVHDWSDLRSSA
jgi:hypothetical protein